MWKFSRHVVACVLVACAHAPAIAQLPHSIDRADVRHYAELLELDDAQQDAAMALHQAYRTEMRELFAAMAQRVAQVHGEALSHLDDESVDRADLKEAMLAADGNDEIYELAECQLRTERKLLDDILVLATTPEQRDGVERVGRAWRRDRVSAKESTWGESADLSAMIRHLQLDAHAGVEPIVLEYEKAIDPLRLMQLGGKPARGAATMGEIQWGAKRINIVFAQRITQALPAEAHERWGRAVREAFWPEPFARSGPLKVLMTLFLARNLSDEERAVLEDIQSRYERRARPINRTWARAIDAHLKADADQDWESAADANETIYECREDRRQLDKEFEAILSEFQRKR